MKLIYLFLVVSLNLLNSAVLYSQQLTGKIILPTVSSKPAKRGPYGKPALSKNEGTSESTKNQIIVWIESNQVVNIPSSENSIPVLNQKEIQFDPRLIVIKQGEKVRITNNDPVYHNVFSLSSVKKFDIGRRIQGESVDVAFEKAGIVQIFCDIHSHMNAEIIVLSNKTQTWTTANEDGSFEFNDLPLGNLKIHAYSPGFKEYSSELIISEKNELVSITLDK
jgi:plastocyanin